MNNLRRWSLFAVALTAAAVVTASAQPPATGVSKPDGYVKASYLIGLNVNNTRNEHLGKVEDLVIDLKEKKVRYAALSFGGVVRADKYFAVPWDTLGLGKDSKNFVMAMEKTDLEKLPGFDRYAWPAEANKDLGKGAATGVSTTGGNAADRVRDAAKEAGRDVRQAGHEMKDAMLGSHVWRANGLLGLTVRNEQDEELGKISDMAINLRDGTILYVALAHGGVGGVGSKLFAVPVNCLELLTPTLKPNEHVFLLRGITKASLDQSNGFDKDNWPNAADTTTFKPTGTNPGR